jgi:hypothetical protein
MVDQLIADALASSDDHVEHAFRKDLGNQRPSLRVVSGVISDGFSTIALPAASAGPIFQAAS